MKFINPIFKTQKIKDFLVDLIHSYDRNAYDKLTYENKREFALLISEILFQHDKSEYVSEPHEAMHRYENLMKALFNDILSDYESEWNEWMQYACKHGDPDEIYDSYIGRKW